MSLKSRLLSGMLVVAIVLAGAVWFVAARQRSNLIRQLDRQLDNATPVAARFEPPFSPQDGPPPPVVVATGVGEPAPSISDTYVGIIDIDGNQIDLVSGALLAAPLVLDDTDTAALRDRVHNPQQQPPVVRMTADDFRLLAVPAPGGEVLVVAKPLAGVDAAVRQLVWTLLVAALIVLLAMALTTWWVIRLGLRPIAAMTNAATSIANGDRSQRVSTEGNTTEAGQLGKAFNEMLDQRDIAEDRLRQFVGDASHELRTPLTSIRGYVDLMQQGAFADGQIDDVLRRMSAESTRMQQLVEDLLLLAQLDQQRPLHLTTIDLVTVVNDEADAVRALQPQRPVHVHVPTAAPVVADDRRIRQLVAGLVHNVVVHTPADTALTLTVATSPTAVTLEVTDDGPGMDPDTAAHAFDRFRRGDPSRSRHTGGTGLGLAIAKSLAEAHGATLSLTSAPGHGCTVTLTLPVT